MHEAGCLPALRGKVTQTGGTGLCKGSKKRDKHGVCGTLDGTLGGTLDSQAHRLEKALVPGALSTMGRRGWPPAKQSAQQLLRGRLPEARLSLHV